MVENTTASWSSTIGRPAWYLRSRVQRSRFRGKLIPLPLGRFLDHCLGMSRVFRPGAVIKRDLLCAGCFETERKHSGRDAGAAAGGDGLFEIDSLFHEDATEFFDGL